MITANIHHVTAISLQLVKFGSFISHKLVFATEDGQVEINAFASGPLELVVKPPRDTHIDSEEAL
jgi:hypothetical protein